MVSEARPDWICQLMMSTFAAVELWAVDSVDSVG